MEIARQIQQMVASNKLLSPTELKLKLAELISIISFTAEKEFELLEFFDSYIRLKGIQPAHIEVKLLGINEMMAKASQLVQAIDVKPQPLRSQEEQQLLLVDLHNAVIKLCILHDQMRQNRLRLTTDMIEQLEQAGALQELQEVKK